MSTGAQGNAPLSVAAALQNILDSLPEPKYERVFIDDAEGLILAEDIEADQDNPADDNSAMDGFAVRADDLRHASARDPVRLTVIDESRAGFPSDRELGEGQAVRISTGALIPMGATAVAIREEVQEIDDETVSVLAPVDDGAHIRRAGEHLRRGEVVLRSGQELGPSEIGMAAFLGADRVLCRKRLTAAVLSTGSELVEPGKPLQRGQVRDSNSYALVCALKRFGCRAVVKHRLPDSLDETVKAIEEISGEVDLIVTSGGISAGWHDLVRTALERLGGELSFHRVKMKPGKPVAYGRLGEVAVFCLPGNPVSSLVTFELFVRPALQVLRGRSPEPKRVQARLLEEVPKRVGLSTYFRVKFERLSDGDLGVRLSGPQGSHQLRTFLEADGLLEAGEEQADLKAGQKVSVRLLRPLEDD